MGHEGTQAQHVGPTLHHTLTDTGLTNLLVLLAEGELRKE